MPSIEIPLDPIFGIDIEAVARKELQILDVIRIEFLPGRVICETSACVPPLSTVLATHTSGSVIAVEVIHHAAILPHFLSMFLNGPPVYIIHADSHDDLGSPNVVPDATGRLIDRWTGKTVSPQEPFTVRSAVDSSAIEIGSYLTLALHLLPVIGIAFVFPDHSTANIAGVRNPSSITVGWAEDDLLNRGVRRLRCRPSRDGSNGIPILRCDGHCNLAELGSIIPRETPIILDIDCDYFDDADEVGGLPHDACTMDVAGFMQQVQMVVPRKHLKLISLSHSPGFCPRTSVEVICAEVLHSLDMGAHCRWKSW
ncbi:MAG: hypothetical protein Q8O14_12945 [bacterium]|nr:hypothetical protein [bacterium]